MAKRRLVGVSMLLAWLLVPAMGAVSAVTADLHSSCDDHLCQCPRHRPSAPAATPKCHEAAEASECQMSSRCHHESGSGAVSSFRSDSLLSAKEELHPYLESSHAVPAPAVHPETGHTRIDPYPPRIAS